MTDPYRLTAEITLTADLIWLKRRCAGSIRANLHNAAWRNRGTLQLSIVPARFVARDHCVSDFLLRKTINAFDLCIVSVCHFSFEEICAQF